MTRAFTLIELLIVISIIALLMGMLIVAIPNVIYNAKALKTASRMDAVLQGLSRVGQQEGSASMIMQRMAHLGPNGATRSGVYQFDTAHGRMLPSRADTTAPGSSDDNRFYTGAALADDLYLPYIFGFPWGKNDLICPTATSPATAADPNSVVGKTVVSNDQTGMQHYYVSNVTIDQLNVDHQYTDAANQKHLSSITLMTMADILPPDDTTTPGDESQTAYLTDRSSERAWNDAWGNPLVIAWGIFQPGGATPADGAPDTDFNDASKNVAGSRCAEAWRQYQYNRSVYIAVASAGPIPYDVSAGTSVDPSSYNDATLDDWRTKILPQIWAEATTVCQERTAFGIANPVADWGSDAFDRPPWQGVKKAKIRVGGSPKLRCQLSQPHEFK